MKKVLGLLVFVTFVFLITGCGKVDETWNGIYKNDSNYSVLIFVDHNQKGSLAVLQEGDNFKFYPVDYPNYFNATDTELTVIVGEPIKVIKDGLKIKVLLESEEKGVWEDIEGEYTKVKNVKSFKFD